MHKNKTSLFFLRYCMSFRPFGQHLNKLLLEILSTYTTICVYERKNSTRQLYLHEVWKVSKVSMRSENTPNAINSYVVNLDFDLSKKRPLSLSTSRGATVKNDTRAIKHNNNKVSACHDWRSKVSSFWCFCVSPVTPPQLTVLIPCIGYKLRRA